MFSPFIVVALLAAVNASPVAEVSPAMTYPHGRIVGGESAVIQTYPYQVALEYLGRLRCGGSIISSKYVLTAGHCVVSTNTRYFQVRAGSSYNGKGGSLHEAEQIVLHEKYSANRYGVPINDVALIKVKQPFVLDDSRQPIDLYSGEAKSGAKAVITGWGDTGYGLPKQLQTVVIPIVSKELCNQAYKTFGGLPAGQICAAFYGEGGKDSCQGDSGGPLAIDGRIAGIISWGNGCAKPDYPGVYTEVSAYRDWILKNSEN